MYYNLYTVLALSTSPMDIAVCAHGQLWHCTVVWPWMKLLWKDLFQKSLSEAVPPSLNNCIWIKTLHDCPCLDYTATCLAIYLADLNPDPDLSSWLDLGPTSSLQMRRVITWLLAGWTWILPPDPFRYPCSALPYCIPCQRHHCPCLFCCHPQLLAHLPLWNKSFLLFPVMCKSHKSVL